MPFQKLRRVNGNYRISAGDFPSPTQNFTVCEVLRGTREIASRDFKDDSGIQHVELLEHLYTAQILLPWTSACFQKWRKCCRSAFWYPMQTSEGFSSCWYNDIYMKWVYRHRKCLATCGDFIEKVNRSLNFDGAIIMRYHVPVAAHGFFLYLWTFFTLINAKT